MLLGSLRSEGPLRSLGSLRVSEVTGFVRATESPRSLGSLGSLGSEEPLRLLR